MSDVTPDCLDAETLAAWMDDGLPAAAMRVSTALRRCDRAFASWRETVASCSPVSRPVWASVSSCP